MSEKFTSIYEIKKLQDLLKKSPFDEEFSYALTNTIVDFLGKYLSGKDEFDEVSFNYLIDLLGTEHPHLQDRVQKNISKLMIKKYKPIRKALLLTYAKRLKKNHKEQIDKILELSFSPLYFSYGYLEAEDWGWDKEK